ncbi:MAG: hypothetical protein E8D45_04855 [Nitrospira sp.]|nr:MAG: hypothetical protein E8D45_04855 [Nitrospira sp.]
MEIDLRRARSGSFYVSHDPAPVTHANRAEQYCGLIRQYPESIVALNVKELGYEREMVAFLESEKVADQMFLFDMELLEDEPGRTARIFRGLSPAIHIAARVSDRSEPLKRALSIQEADTIWLDEFDRLWATRFDIQQLRGADKAVYAVSPELHGFTLDVARNRWRDYVAWGIDGVCTDYPALLNSEVGAGSMDARR